MWLTEADPEEVSPGPNAYNTGNVRYGVLSQERQPVGVRLLGRRENTILTDGPPSTSYSPVNSLGKKVGIAVL